LSTYDPTNPTHRRDLAGALLAKLATCGFTPVRIEGTKEAVYERVVDKTDGRIRVLVYTSVIPGPSGTFEVRSNGDDSIKVCAVYRTQREALKGRERGLVKDRRIHRTGDIQGKDGIMDRVHQRMRDVWTASKTGECCPSCQAPKFLAKSGNLCCSELCWKSDSDINRPYRPTSYRSRYAGSHY